MGIDLGTSGVKVLVINQTGKVLVRQTEEYPLLTPRPGWAQ
ncbi:MAG TPA: FGGY family carbohydrate kinase, partial [bacterium]|nr:FGGY family carbohydrate kinase [bacterium]